MSRTLEKTDYEPYKRLLLEISFDGSEYNGWQVQPHCNTVQAVLQRLLKKLYGGQHISILGSSRTDAGVHAIGFAACFLCPERPHISNIKLLKALNSLLPASIRVRKVSEVDLEFHARYDALGKAYSYILNLGMESPFSSRYSWLMQTKININAMQQAADFLIGTHDYSSFVVERHKYENAVRTIYSIDFMSAGSFLCITFKGNGFLYKMIRCIVGALEAVGRGFISVEQFKKIFEAQDRSLAPGTAPAHGLFLVKVFYEQCAMENFKLTTLPFCINLAEKPDRAVYIKP
ncbi:tRNA pseudouridine(38-40) synthase TruA [Lentisphaerota bacterium ZTH]|nr:tRNA pseudouridine(38-40) synthase TruA [Lentisphaerota bacterium]WET07707.1 tRNA pseudouridine(38-40) synthase TruA [Lentisphaerota bacterium ZTH]